MNSKEFNRDYIAKIFTDEYVGLVGYASLMVFLGDRASKVFRKLEEKTKTSIKAQKWQFKPYHGKMIIFYLRP